MWTSYFLRARLRTCASFGVARGCGGRDRVPLARSSRASRSGAGLRNRAACASVSAAGERVPCSRPAQAGRRRNSRSSRGKNAPALAGSPSADRQCDADRESYRANAAAVKRALSRSGKASRSPSGPSAGAKAQDQAAAEAIPAAPGRASAGSARSSSAGAATRPATAAPCANAPGLG
jgi:hypothetical protein